MIVEPQEAGRREHDHALARHERHAADQVLEADQSDAGFVFAGIQHLRRLGLRDGDSRAHIGQIHALERFLCRGVQSLIVMPVDDGVGHVEADIRAVLRCGAGNWSGREPQQGGVELFAVRGEIERGLAGGGEDGGAVGGLQVRPDVLLRRFANLDEIAVAEVHIVEKKSHEMIGRDDIRLVGGGGFLVRGAVDFRRPDNSFAAGFFQRKLRDDLRFASVGEGEVLLAKRADGLAAFIAHDDRHQDQVDLGFERDRFFLCGHFSGLVSCRRRLDGQCSGRMIRGLGAGRVG